MIEGSVDYFRRAYVPLRVRGRSGEADIDFLVDTGFDGALLLPNAQAITLGLERRSDRVVRVADDSVVNVAAYDAAVVWDGAERKALVLGVGAEPLLGMTLMAGHRMTVDVVDGGGVSIEPL